MGRVSDARERLVEATIDLIWRHSYGAVTVDAICEQSGVKKGSFYHFFKSKDELVIEALEAHWQSRKPILDELFSATVPPIERLRKYFAYVYTRQQELKAKMGQFPGCFYSAVGVECGETRNPEIAAKVKSILGIYTRYYESALRDGEADGSIEVTDPAGKAKSLFAFMEGVLVQARIQNDPEIIRNLGASAMAFLGVVERRTEAR
jgi:TetR/AcrR family transcriptional repressor of nem operon